MKHVKTLVLFIALFPTTTFADSLGHADRDINSQTTNYESETQRLNTDSDQLALALLNKGTASGTNRAPASEGFQVTLVKRHK